MSIDVYTCPCGQTATFTVRVYTSTSISFLDLCDGCLATVDLSASRCSFCGAFLLPADRAACEALGVDSPLCRPCLARANPLLESEVA